MGLRFFKSFRLSKNARINISKRGVGLSYSIPGTGLHFSTLGKKRKKRKKSKAKSKRTLPASAKKISLRGLGYVFFILLGAFCGFFALWCFVSLFDGFKFSLLLGMVLFGTGSFFALRTLFDDKDDDKPKSDSVRESLSTQPPVKSSKKLPQQIAETSLQEKFTYECEVRLSIAECYENRLGAILSLKQDEMNADWLLIVHDKNRLGYIKDNGLVCTIKDRVSKGCRVVCFLDVVDVRFSRASVQIGIYK